MKKKIIYRIVILFIALCCNLNKANSQATSGYLTPSAANVPSTPGVDYLGWAGSVTVPLNIRTNANHSIYFFTDSIYRAIIDSLGRVGVGINFYPVHKLDVDSGNINVNYPDSGYMINSKYVLWNNGNVRNIYVGVNAGKANAAASAINNTFCGYDAGNMDSTGFSNSFFGYNAGLYNSSGYMNTYVGDSAGLSETSNGLALGTGSENTFVGRRAGFAIAAGSWNTIIGSQAGYHLEADSSNIFIGHVAGYNTVSNKNVMIGDSAAYFNESGKYNVIMGNGAGLKNNYGGDNVILGFQAGHENATSSYNTMTGYQVGYYDSSGTENAFYGIQAGELNKTGSNNAFFGANSGLNAGNAITTGADSANSFFGAYSGASSDTGYYNVYLGYHAQDYGTKDSAFNNLHNSVAIGANTIVPKSNQVILGNDTQYVGIRLSGVAGNNGPQQPLEINADATHFSYTGTGGSGLRFRQLTHASAAGASNGKVLSVDASGDVILVTDSIGSGGGGGSGGVNACGSAMDNYVTKFINTDSICNSLIYDNGTNVGIGLGSAAAYKLDVNGNIDAKSVGGTSYGGYYIDDAQVLDVPGNQNTFLGVGCGPGYVPTLPSSATFVGYGTGANSKGGYDTYIGALVAPFDITGFQNTLIGMGSAYELASGGNNTMVGFSSGYNCSTCIQNVLIGSSAGFNADTSANNVSIGYFAGANDSSGTDNVSIGTKAGGENGSYNYNVTIGSEAGYNSTDNYNTMLGYYAGENHYTGGFNTYIGANTESSFPDTGSSYNTLLGYGASNLSGLTFAGAIGAYAYIASSNAISIGEDNGSTWPDRVLMGFSAVPPDTARRLYVDAIPGGQAAYFGGNCYTTGVFTSSDSKLKTNIQTITDPDSILNQITPRTFDFDQADYPTLHLPSGSHYGVIAEEIQNVMPTAVENIVSPPVVDTSGRVVKPSVSFMAVNYQEFIPLLIGAYKQQKQALDSMQAQLAQLQAQVNNCCASSSQLRTNQSDTSTTNVTLSNTGGIILNQNDPNPFAENTTITFNIPGTVAQAKIIFYDNLGRIINTVVINDRGPGQLLVYASNLSAGIYSYSLLADGQVIDTKKMVCTK